MATTEDDRYRFDDNEDESERVSDTLWLTRVMQKAFGQPLAPLPASSSIVAPATVLFPSEAMAELLSSSLRFLAKMPDPDQYMRYQLRRAPEWLKPGRHPSTKDLSVAQLYLQWYLFERIPSDQLPAEDAVDISAFIRLFGYGDEATVRDMLSASRLADTAATVTTTAAATRETNVSDSASTIQDLLYSADMNELRRDYEIARQRQLQSTETGPKGDFKDVLDETRKKYLENPGLYAGDRLRDLMKRINKQRTHSLFRDIDEEYVKGERTKKDHKAAEHMWAEIHYNNEDDEPEQAPRPPDRPPDVGARGRHHAHQHHRGKGRC